MPLSSLMEEVAAPYRNFGVGINVRVAGDASPEPIVARNPAVLYGLGNLMENAVDFAAKHVAVAANWTEDNVELSIADDGPGFAPEIIGRIGEPYVTSRPDLDKDDAPSGLGLGFFIAKTLLERAGATLSFENRKLPEHGASIFVRWNRGDLERSLGQSVCLM
jgi:two-component system, sensor histidine kinase RegB